MVVVCESCSTRFQLDEARIPPKGTLVRCSRCKATFIVRPPSLSYEETVQNAVEEVTEAGQLPLPEPTEDLFDKGGEELGETGTRPAGAHDEAWEFDDAPARKPAAPARKPPPPALGIAFPESASRAPAPVPIEEIGKPEEWDLLGDSVAVAASEATFVEPVAVESKPAPPPPERASTPAQQRAEPLRSAPERRANEVTRAMANAGRTALRTTAWLALAALFSVGIARVVPRAPALTVPAAASEVIGLPDGEARGVHLRFVENAFAGTLFVVQGELARASADPTLGLRVHWVDERGARLGAGEWARPVPEARELRERTPEALRKGPAAEAEAPPREGAFAAIFEAIPAEASGVALALEPLPAPPQASAPVTPEEAASGAEAPADATASSPPSPRPSSE